MDSFTTTTSGQLQFAFPFTNEEYLLEWLLSFGEKARLYHIHKPFWGDSCPVKLCCENKGKEHCGECLEFPCALLNQFSYDEKQVGR